MIHRPTITAAIIAQDEARRLAELLPRLDWADEVVLVDGGSRDGTPELAAAHRCRVFGRRFDCFAAQRNFAIEQAAGDWVFSIDADERPTPRLVAEIRYRVGSGRYDAYRAPIRSRIFGRRIRWSGTQDDCRVRLFRRGRARWTGDVHEVLRVAGRVGTLRHAIQHESLPDLGAFLAKVHRYTSLEAHARVAAGRPPRPSDLWLRPPREVFRRLVWKLGLFDVPHGWAFSVLSGLSEWVLARKHQTYWNEAVHE